MASKILTQRSFTAGELTPRLYGRTETTEYGSGLSSAVNCTLTAHGPIKRRNGSKFVAEVKDSSVITKLIEYQFSQDVSFILEFGNQYIRFYTNTGQVVEAAKTITAITQFNPGVITSNTHGFANGDHVYITGVVGMTQVNNSIFPYKVANVTANTFTLQTIAGVDINTTSYTAYSSGGSATRIYEISSPYTTAQLSEISWRQNGNTLYLAHPDVAPYTLVRTTNVSWKLTLLDFKPPPTYESGYLNTGVTMTPAATTGTDINFTASGALFLAGDVGRQIINTTSGQTGRASITAVTSTTVALCDIVENFTNTSAIASANWKLDLSPVVDLEFDSTQAGAVCNIRSEYTNGFLGPRLAITAITAASPAVVTSNAHGLANGELIQIQDVVGMTQLNNHVFTVSAVTANTFALLGENASGYTTYTSGGIVRKVFTGIGKDAFRSADVGKYILANGGVLEILSVNSATNVDALIHKTLNAIDNTGNWSLEVDTWSSTRGYPRAVGLYEQRLAFGGTDAQPNVIWLSEIGIFDGFGVGPDDEDSIEVELVSDEVNEINWIAAGRELIVGTSGGELTIGTQGSGALTPATISVKPRTYHGSRLQHIATVKEEVLFIQGSKRKIRTNRYDFNSDTYVGEDLTFLAEHITEDLVQELTYVEEPDTVIYAITEAGTMLCGLYDRSKKVVGWTRFNTDGKFESLRSITKDTQDQIWTITQRSINGVTKRYVEVILRGDGDLDTDGYSDCYLVLSTPHTITGITNATTAVVTSAAHGFANGDSVIIKGLIDPFIGFIDPTKTDITELNNGVYTIANVAANTFELVGVNSSAWNRYGSGGQVWKRTAALTGIHNLEGKTVQVKADGAVAGTAVVTSGAITLENAAGEVVIGLPYTTSLVTLEQEFDVGLGSMQGQFARWVKPLIKVHESGKPMLNGQYIPARDTADYLGRRTPLFSGYLDYGALSWGENTILTITMSDPLPLEVSLITGKVAAGVI